MKPKKQDLFTIVFSLTLGIIFVILLALHSGPSYAKDKNIINAAFNGLMSLISDPMNITINGSRCV